jgi:hypothetical protein
MNKLRSFETGATRSPDTGRYDPEGFLSPIVLERYCEYLNKHRIQSDGTVRASDNWQKGIPLEVYAKGLQRHNLHFGIRHDGFAPNDPGAAADIEEDLCAVIFNAQGYLLELIRDRYSPLVASGLADPQDELTFGPLPVHDEPDADGWIAWNGGECPVPKRTRVSVHFRNGQIHDGNGPWNWAHFGHVGDIVAYKVLS